MKRVTYEKILLPHDGSLLASAILPHLLAIEGGFNAEVIVIQVIDSLIMLNSKFELTPTFSPGFNTGELVGELFKTEKKAAQHNLDKIKKELVKYGISKVRTVIKDGIPGDQIALLAKKERVDLIMISTHGRSGLGRILLGSTTDYIIRHVECPVLSIHPRGKYE